MNNYLFCNLYSFYSFLLKMTFIQETKYQMLWQFFLVKFWLPLIWIFEQGISKSSLSTVIVFSTYLTKTHISLPTCNKVLLFKFFDSGYRSVHFCTSLKRIFSNIRKKYLTGYNIIKNVLWEYKAYLFKRLVFLEPELSRSFKST